MYRHSKCNLNLLAWSLNSSQEVVMVKLISSIRISLNCLEQYCAKYGQYAIFLIIGSSNKQLWKWSAVKLIILSKLLPLYVTS